MGVYASSQFLGAFAGGTLGGLLHGQFGLKGVFALGTLGALAWLAVAWSMQNPRYLSSYLLNVGELNEAEAWDLTAQLTQVRGVVEAVVIATDGVAYLKVDRGALDEAALRAYAAIDR